MTPGGARAALLELSSYDPEKVRAARAAFPPGDGGRASVRGLSRASRP